MEFYFTPPSTPVKKRLSAHKKTINSHLPHFPSSPSSSSSSFSSSFLPSSNQQGEGLFPGEREGEGLELKYSNSPKKESSARRNSHTDRFIPNRASLDVEFTNSQLCVLESSVGNNSSTPSNATSTTTSPKKNRYKEELNEITNTKEDRRMIDCFSRNSFEAEEDFYTPKSSLKRRDSSLLSSSLSSSPSSSLYTSSSSSRLSIARAIPSAPCRVLDAPELMDDYYLNLLSWGQSNNIIAVALKHSVYLWHASDGKIVRLLTLEDEDTQYITSVNWSPTDNILAVGSSNSSLQLWDASSSSLIRTLPGHSNRVSSLSWNTPSFLSSGSRDSLILNHDIRIPMNRISTFSGHTQEVCGLSWSPDGSTLASGGNENLLCIWDAATGTGGNPPLSSASTSSFIGPRLAIDQHIAAVKAVSWCPWTRHTLASGGGTADRTIRMWNSSTGVNLKTVDTGSQVCSIQWSDSYKELVSSHGFSDNQLILWKYPSMTKVREFRGHSSRVLHLAKSPDGSMICSASADETIRFWELFGGSSRGGGRSSSLLHPLHRNGGSSPLNGSSAATTVLSQGLLLR